MNSLTRRRLRSCHRFPTLVPRGLIWLLTLCLLLTANRNGYATDPQTLEEYEIKAAFFFNFTRFVEWPAESFTTPISPILACVSGNTALSDLLVNLAAGKIVNGRSVSIKRVKATDDLRPCHLVFLGIEERRTAQILESLKGTSTLTVGESAGFTRSGGMINFFIQDNKVKLELNLDAASRAGLRINSKLIAVARLVPNNPAGGAN